MLTQLSEPSSSASLMFISKSPLAKNVATVVEASGNSRRVSLMFIGPFLSANGHVQSTPNGKSSFGHTFGLKLSGSSFSRISQKSVYEHEPTLIPPAT